MLVYRFLCGKVLKDIEREMTAIIGGDRLINKMKDKINLWINIALTIWQETVKRRGLGNEIKMLKWRAYDTDFIPSMTIDLRSGGIRVSPTTIHFCTRGHLRALNLSRKNTDWNKDFNRYLQLRHYINHDLRGALNLEASDLMRVFRLQEVLLHVVG